MTGTASIFDLTPLGYAFSFALGLIMGSFANVCICRLPEEEPFILTRSHCRHCQSMIPWYHNIPVFSFLWLRAKCHQCGKPISLQYPLVEMVSGFVFLIVYVNFGWGGDFFSFSLLLWTLLTVSIIDFHHRIIPDELSLGGIVVGFLFSFLPGSPDWWESVTGMFLGGGIFFLVAYLYEKITKREGLGGGDVKLLAMIGAWLGYQSILIVILLSTGLGSIIGLSMMLFQKKDFKTAIPFGPFLALGAIVYVFLKDFLLKLLFPTFY